MEPAQLQLDIRINGYPLNAIGAFAQLPDGRIASPRSELGEMGIAVPGDGPPDELVALHTIQGLSFVYDDETQSIDLEVPESSRIAKDVDGSGEAEFAEASSGTGLVLNYTAFAAGSYDLEESATALDGGSLSLDVRAYSPFGTLRQTGILGTTTFADATALRLDTAWSYSDQRRMLTYQLGDIISGGLNWTRPVRLGGAQIQRDFTLRPDLITMPLPLIEGSAAVPSTLDVYIDGVKTYSNKIQEGPFKVDSIPVYRNSGTARVVVTDTTGRETETEAEFFTSPELLKRDLYDFSVEAGAVRRSFGTESFDYGNDAVAIGSLRYGLTDILTGELHAEAGMNLVGGGAGVLFNGKGAGMFSGAVAASMFDREAGLFLHAGWEWQHGNLGLSAATNRTFGDFQDLAAVSAEKVDGKITGKVPRALDQLTATYRFPKLQSGVGISLIHRDIEDQPRSYIVSGSYSQSFDNDLALFVSAFADFGGEQEFGMFAGLSMPLGKTLNSTAGASASRAGWSATAEVSRPFGDGENPVSWRLAHAEGESRFTTARGAMRSNHGDIEGLVIQGEKGARANAAVDGSVVVAGGGVMTGRRINDAFAVVDAGAAGVPVEFENRFAGKTGGNGKLLVPNLNAYHKNKIAIDVEGLPLNAEFDATETVVVPRQMAGVLVDFGVNKDQTAALVILTDETGNYIAESAEVYLDGAEEPFLTGYDGQVYLTGIKSSNRITVKRDGNQCGAKFAYDETDDTQTVIGPLTCS